LDRREERKDRMNKEEGMKGGKKEDDKEWKKCLYSREAYPLIERWQIC
jgi:hypothetical protein